MNGLLLTLRKKRSYENTPNINAFDANTENKNVENNTKEIYRILGYYDELEVTPIKTFDGFAPQINDSNLLDLSERDICINEVSIKLISPDSLSSPHENNPLLSILMIHLTEDRMQNHSLSANATEVKRIISSMKNAPSEYDICYCLGSADIVILCRSNNFKSVYDLRHSLQCQCDFISESYFIPCLSLTSENNEFGKWNNALDKNIKMSIRAQFKDNGMMGTFNESIISALNNLGITDNNIKFGLRSGDSEINILPSEPVYKFARLYQKGEYLYQCNSKNNLVSMRTNLLSEDHYDNIVTEGVTEKTKERLVALESRKNEYQKHLKQIFDLLKKHSDIYGQFRVLVGYTQMLNSYFDIAEKEHHYEVRYMYDPFLSVLKKLLIYSLEQYNNTNNQSEQAKMMDALNEFREYFSEIINDISRSDQQWIEGKFLVHQVMGNSKKIIYAYTIMVRLIVNHFKTQSDGDNCILISSGGTDVVKNIIYFNQLLSVDFHDKITGLVLPENSLFTPNCSFYAFHEAFHFIGGRYRLERKDKFIRSIASRFAFEIISEITPTFFNNRHKASNTKPIDERIIGKYKIVLAINLSSYLYRIIDSKFTNKQAEHFSEIEKDLFPILSELLDPDNRVKKEEKNKESGGRRIVWDGNTLIYIACMYESLWNHHCKIICKQLNEDSVWNFKESDIKWNETKTGSTIHYSDIIEDSATTVRIFLDRYFNRYSHNLEKLIIDPDKHYKEIKELYKESYADLCSAVLLNYDLKSYLLMIAPDSKTLNRLSPHNFVGRGRLFSVLNVMFFNDIISEMKKDNVGDSQKEIKEEEIRDKEIAKIAEILNKNLGELLESKLIANKEEAKKIIDALLNRYGIYRSNIDAFRPLEEYLLLCKEKMEASLKSAVFLDDLRVIGKGISENQAQEILDFANKYT